MNKCEGLKLFNKLKDVVLEYDFDDENFVHILSVALLNFNAAFLSANNDGLKEQLNRVDILCKEIKKSVIRNYKIKKSN